MHNLIIYKNIISTKSPKHKSILEIQDYVRKDFLQFIRIDLSHDSHERSGCIYKPEGHDELLKKSLICFESRLPLFIEPEADLVVSTFKINFWKNLSTMQNILHVI